jgi:hypothetical protein
MAGHGRGTATPTSTRPGTNLLVSPPCDYPPATPPSPTHCAWSAHCRHQADTAATARLSRATPRNTDHHVGKLPGPRRRRPFKRPWLTAMPAITMRAPSGSFHDNASLSKTIPSATRPAGSARTPFPYRRQSGERDRSGSVADRGWRSCRARRAPGLSLRVPRGAPGGPPGAFQVPGVGVHPELNSLRKLWQARWNPYSWSALVFPRSRSRSPVWATSNCPKTGSTIAFRRA